MTNPLADLGKVDQSDLAQWFTLKKRIEADKKSETLLRTKIFRFFFPTPKEGSNKAFNDELLGANFRITATLPVTRDIDEGAFDALKPKFAEAGIDLNKLIKYKPEVSIRQYRVLSQEQRALFDQCLVIKDGSPQMKIEPKTSRDE